MDLEAAAAGQVLATEHAAEALPRVGVSVEDVHLEVSFLTWRDVGAVGAVPPAEGLHHHHVGQAVLEGRARLEASRFLDCLLGSYDEYGEW